MSDTVVYRGTSGDPMSYASWTVDTADGPRRIDVSYGYWFGWLRVSVDGVVLRSQRALGAMAGNLGVCVEIPFGARRALISIRPNRLATSYRFALRIDGAFVAGDDRGRPIAAPPLAAPGSGDRWPGSYDRRVVAGREPPLLELRPNWPTMSRAVVWLGLGAVVWFFVFAFAADYGLEAAGFQREQRPQLVRNLMVGLMVAPGALWLLSPLLGRFRGFRWMWASPQPAVTLTREGMEIALPDRGTGWFAWQEIGRLFRGKSIWGNVYGDLLAPDDALLVRLPAGLLSFRRGFTSDLSLAQAVVDARPDRYVLTRANWAGTPDTFGLQAAAGRLDIGVDERLSGWSERRRLVTMGVVIVAVPIIVFSLVRALMP